MVTWPSGKAKVCKTFIHQFKSGRHLHKTVMKKMSQSFFFVVASKIGDFANRFLNTVLQCCPTIFGRFAHPEAHFLCHFLEFGRGVGNFFEKKQNKSCCFQNVSISPQPISCWLRVFFVFCSCRQNGNCTHFHSFPHYANVWRVLKSDIFYVKTANF